MSVMGLTQDFGHPVLVELPRIALTKTVPPAVRKFAVQPLATKDEAYDQQRRTSD